MDLLMVLFTVFLFPADFGLYIVMIAKEEVVYNDARMLSLNEFGFLG